MKKLTTIFAVITMMMPVFVSAQTVILPVNTNAPGTLTTSSANPSAGYVQNSPTDAGVGANDPRASNFQLVPCSGVAKTVNGVTSPACDFNQLIILANRVIKFLLYLAIPLVMGMILYTGYLYLTANGDTGQLEKAKKMFIPVIIGMFWIGASYIVIYTVLDTFLSTNTSTSAKDAIKILKGN
jgi:hypothetical protein